MTIESPEIVFKRAYNLVNLNDRRKKERRRR